VAEIDPKAELYKRIVSQVPDYRVLDLMQLHNFWPQNQDLPPDPQPEVLERAEIEKAISELRKSHSKAQNPDKALAEERKRRWEESKKRRAEKKAEKELKAKARREAWTKTQQTTIVHAGDGVSGGLQNTQSDVEKLRVRNLPFLHNAQELADLFGIPLAELKWLTFHRKGATLVHYHRYGIPKKTGGTRHISAPKPKLKELQNAVLAHILNVLEPEAEAHGFVAQRSIVTNSAPHVGKPVVVNLDLKDFFPSITFRRVKGLFESFGYSEQVSTVLSLICTEPPRVAAQVNGKIYHVALGERVLPQGASTSPAITNLLCRKLDRRLAGLAKKHDFAYTRYADDLTFSGNNPNAVGRILKSVRSIIANEGFTEHPSKTKVMRKANRQEVTGVVVNERQTVSRKDVRELRAILHNAKKTGLDAQNRSQHPFFAEQLRGRIAFICMVDPTRGEPLRKALDELVGGSQETN